MKDAVKVVLKTALFTFLSIVVLCLATYFIMLFFFPTQLGDFFYSLGSESMASSLYHRVYEKSDDINYIYKSLNIEIRQKNYENIAQYYEELLGDDEWADFSKNIIKNYEQNNLNILEKSLCLDEINTINSNYVIALMNINQIEKAQTFAISELENNGEFALKNIGGYSINGILKDIDKETLDDKNIPTLLQNYFDKLVDLFNDTDPLSDVDKSYLVRLGNRIITIGTDVNTLIARDSEKVSENADKIVAVNNRIMGLM